MASYRGHLTFSTGLAVVYGGVAAWKLGVPLPVAGVGAVFTALGGLLPDLDSDSGVPVRELFGLAGAAVPLMLLRTLATSGLSAEETLLIAAGSYALIRFVFSYIFRHITVHRGMFHSIPAMLVAGLVVFLAYRHPVFELRAYLAVGVMVGFLSHLVLDELCAVDFRGLTPKLNQFAGSAVKMYSTSWGANLVCYSLLSGLGYMAYQQYQPPQTNPSTPLAAAKQRLDFHERPLEKQPLRWQPASPNRQPPAAAVPPRVVDSR
jgi:membrane-bound metal-dependent hydrolase YbcI (DUF457 family)